MLIVVALKYDILQYLLEGQNYSTPSWYRTASSLRKQTSSGFELLSLFHSQDEFGWFSQMASKLLNLFKTCNFNVKYTVMIWAAFANLLEIWDNPWDNWVQVAFPRGREKTKTLERSHRHCSTPAVRRAVFVWVHHCHINQKSFIVCEIFLSL